MAKPYTHRLQSKTIESVVTTVASGSITLQIDENYPHNFAGVVFYNDAGGVTPVTPSAGTVEFTVKTVNQPQGFQAILNGTVDANAPNQVSWDGNALEVLATFTGVTGATHARLYYTGNQS